MPSFCASAAAAEAPLAVPPPELVPDPVLPVLPEEPDEPELEEPVALLLPEELPEVLPPPAVARLDVAEPPLALSDELPPQALKERQAGRQARTAAARSSNGGTR
jgi:hypothetical protein